MHGPCRDTVDAAVRALELELNSAEALASSSACDGAGVGVGIGAYHPAQVEVAAGAVQVWMDGVGWGGRLVFLLVCVVCVCGKVGV